MFVVFYNYSSWDWDFLLVEYRDVFYFNFEFEILEFILNFELKIK